VAQVEDQVLHAGLHERGDGGSHIVVDPPRDRRIRVG
jgi:hypothetical protein